MRKICIAAILLVVGFAAVAQDTITLTWKGETVFLYSRSFLLETSVKGIFVVNWGDEKTDTSKASHVYVNPYYADTAYTVTIFTTTPNCRFITFDCYDYSNK